jgi:hypothetical protein
MNVSGLLQATRLAALVVGDCHRLDPGVRVLCGNFRRPCPGQALGRVRQCLTDHRVHSVFCLAFLSFRGSLVAIERVCSGAWGKLALLAHALIYLAIGVVLMTGVLMMDRSIEVFGVVQLPQPMMDPEQIGWFFTTHIWSCIVLSLLVLLHVGAVIVHELCNHQVLRRMSFCSKRRNGLPE